jgi:hypothetical protein
MRKVMLLAAMLAMALAAAAPVFGQSYVNQQANQYGAVDNSVCSQVYNIAVQQYNAGDQNAQADAFADANATAGPYGTAVAAAIAGANAVNIANAAGIGINTVNVCLNNFTVAATPTAKKTVTATAKKTITPKATVHPKKKVISVKGKKHVVVVEGKTVTATATATATAKVAGQVQYKKTVTATATPTATATALPPTGGLTAPGAFALGAGALLIISGLVARRIIQ